MILFVIVFSSLILYKHNLLLSNSCITGVQVWILLIQNQTENAVAQHETRALWHLYACVNPLWTTTYQNGGLIKCPVPRLMLGNKAVKVERSLELDLQTSLQFFSLCCSPAEAVSGLWSFCSCLLREVEDSEDKEDILWCRIPVILSCRLSPSLLVSHVTLFGLVW